jgi:hypothetical protein
MVNKKGVIRIVEVIIAIVITLMFFMFVGARNTVPLEDDYSLVFENLDSDDSLRNCVVGLNETCASSIVDSYIPAIYEFEVDLHENESISVEDKRVYLKSQFFSGNLTLYSPVRLDIYYWIR